MSQRGVERAKEAVRVLSRRSSSAWPFSSFSGEIGGAERRVSPEVQEIGVMRQGNEKVEVEEEDVENWGLLLPELLTEIVRLVEAGAEQWPPRRDVVSLACVCRRWREVALAVVRPPLDCGKITFSSSLKQPGPKDYPIQCFIKRNKRNSTFYLYLGLAQGLTDKGKFLFAARRFRYGSRSEYVISLNADDLFQGSDKYDGKLRSDLLGTKFTIYDGAKASSSRLVRRFGSKRISPQIHAAKSEVGQVAYKFNLLKSKGPRRMHCTLQCPFDDSISDKSPNPAGPLVLLRNKAPRWHEHLQCWCLNFHGRVTVASVKNFQLVAPAIPGQQCGIADEETVLLQFGKVGDDTFTMDYRHPLSAFQAFAVCLTSFGTKFACE